MKKVREFIWQQYSLGVSKDECAERLNKRLGSLELQTLEAILEALHVLIYSNAIAILLPDELPHLRRGTRGIRWPHACERRRVAISTYIPTDNLSFISSPTPTARPLRAETDDDCDCEDKDEDEEEDWPEICEPVEPKSAQSFRKAMTTSASEAS